MFEDRAAHLRLFGFPCRFQTSFFLTALLLAGGVSRSPAVVVGLVLVELLVFLAHELGHALAFRALGIPSALLFHGLGGTTLPLKERELSGWQNAWVSFAGPLAGVAPAALFHLTLLAAPSDVLPSGLGLVLSYGITFAVWINLFNLLPIFPLDGGHIFESFLLRILPGKDAVAILAGIGALLGLALVGLGLGQGMPLTALVALQFVILNGRRLFSALNVGKGKHPHA